MLRNIFISSIFLLCIQICQSQYLRADYNLILGNDISQPDKMQLIFDDNGLARIITISSKPNNLLPSNHSTSSVSDIDGKLQVYSGGCYIANDQYDSLNGSYELIKKKGSSFCRSLYWPIDQSNLLLPWPGHDGNYKLIYTNFGKIIIPWEVDSTWLYPSFSEGLFSCDILRDSRNEIYIKSCWDTIIYDTVCEAFITACYKNNLTDWWLINPRAGSNCYFISSFTEEGIKLNHEQCVGPVVGIRDLWGQAAISPNRKKYARFNVYQLIIMDFDAENGKLANPIEINYPFLDTINGDYGGLAFSSNSRFLYLTRGSKVFQYDLKARDIKSSEVLIKDSYIDTANVGFVHFNAALLGPDGKIYISEYWRSNKLSVIESPNCKGLDCNLVPAAVNLPALNLFSLPNFPVYKIWDENTECTVATQQEMPQQNNYYYYHRESNKLLRNWKYSFVSKRIKMQLTDLQGRVLQSFNELPIEMETTALPAGIYVIQIFEGNTFYWQKLVL